MSAAHPHPPRLLSSSPTKREDPFCAALSSTKKKAAAVTSASSSWRSSSRRTQRECVANSDGASSSSVPSLVHLCRRTIGDRIERYPPRAFAALSESEFESIVELRHAATAPRDAAAAVAAAGARGGAACAASGGGLDGTGRRMPAVSHKVMRAIEEANPHLRDSASSDELVWKDCVEFAFRRTAASATVGGGGGGASDEHYRPLALRMPWPHLVKSLEEAGAELSDCWERCGREAAAERDDTTLEGDDKWVSVEEETIRRRWEGAVGALAEAPMSVELLTATGAGKLLGKIVKSCIKRKQQAGACGDDDEDDVDVDETTRLTSLEEWVILGRTPAGAAAATASSARPNFRRGDVDADAAAAPPSPLARLERMLQGWKNLASKSGVVVTKNDSKIAATVVDDCSGRGGRTTEERHRLDLEAGRKCQTWRELFAALEKRREAVKMSFGSSVRKARRNLATDRPKIKSVSLNVQRKRANKAARMEAMLSGERGANGGGRTGGGGGGASPPRSKITVLRRETVVAASFQKGGVQRPVVAAASGFGCSIASAGAPARGKKRTAADVRRAGGTVALGGGKRMRMPGERAVAAVVQPGRHRSVGVPPASSKSKLTKKISSNYKKSFGR